MDKKAARNLWSLISQQLPEYRLKNRLLARVPLGSILSGVLFESSAFSKELFYIDVFVQPLYVPSDHLVLNFGIRVPGQWDYNASVIHDVANRVLQVMRDQAVEFYQTYGTPELFYRNIPGKFSLKDIHLHQCLVFTAIHLGKKDEAQKHFETLERLVSTTDPKIPWPQAALRETRLVLREAMEDLQAVREHLKQIEVDTLTKLRLNDMPFSSDLREK